MFNLRPLLSADTGWPPNMKGVSVPDAPPPEVLAEIRLARERNGRLHFAIMHEPFLQALLAGDKTIESRFSRHRIDPWMRAAKGDLVMVARPGGIVVGHFLVGDVRYFDVHSVGFAPIRKDFSDGICSRLDPEFWESRENSRYVTLLDVQVAKRCEEFRMSKRDQRAWISFDWQNTLV